MTTLNQAAERNARQAHVWRGVHVADAPECRYTVLDALNEQLALQPDAPAFSQPLASDELLTLTFRQIDTLSQSGAVWMRETARVRGGEPMAIVPMNDLRSVVAIVSAMRLGAPLALLDPNAPPARHAAIVSSLGVRSVIRCSADPNGVDACVFPPLPELPIRGIGSVRIDPAADAFYLATSGSTASSKIVAQTHRATRSNAQSVREHHALGPGDRFMGCLPIHHVNGLHFTVMATLHCGSHALLLAGFDPFLYPKLLASFRPHVASVVPSILQALQATWRDAQTPAGFRYFVSAAAPLSSGLAGAAWQRWGARILQGYGLTETINFTSTMPRGLSDAAYARLMFGAHVPSIGVAMHGNEVGVLRPDGSRAALGEVGEVCVRGHNVMDRYVGNAEATALAFRHGWFHTGDIGCLRSDEEAGSGFIVIAGRIKNIAKVRGESVSLEEMERHLLELPGMRDAACASLPDSMLGEAIVAALAAGPELTDATVLAHLRALFPEAALPRRIVRMDVIPRTPTGKLLRPQLRERLDAA